MKPEEKLKAMGLVLPSVPTPVANYVPFKVYGSSNEDEPQVPEATPGGVAGRLATKRRVGVRATSPRAVPVGRWRLR